MGRTPNCSRARRCTSRCLRRPRPRSASSSGRRARATEQEDRAVSFGGFGGGSPMFGGGGGSRTAAAPGGGLPFAGIPPELQDGVNKLLDDEPEYPAPSAEFSYRSDDQSGKQLTLRALVFAHWQLGAIAVLLVCIVSVTNQLGPALIGYAIDNGMSHGRMSVVIVCTALFLLAIASPRSRQAVAGTGLRSSRLAGDERPAHQGVHAPAAARARLLHQGEGRGDHDQDDQRHRAPAAVAAGWARSAGRPGADDGRDHRDPVHDECRS